MAREARELKQALEDVAQNVLYMLDADCVTLYQYYQADERFEMPPVMKGNFKNTLPIQAEIHSKNAIVWKVVNDGRSLFLDDISLALLKNTIYVNYRIGKPIIISLFRH